MFINKKIDHHDTKMLRKLIQMLLEVFFLPIDCNQSNIKTTLDHDCSVNIIGNVLGSTKCANLSKLNEPISIWKGEQSKRSGYSV